MFFILVMNVFTSVFIILQMEFQVHTGKCFWLNGLLLVLKLLCLITNDLAYFKFPLQCSVDNITIPYALTCLRVLSALPHLAGCAHRLFVDCTGDHNGS